MRVLLVGWDEGDAETNAAEAWLAGHGFVWQRADARTLTSIDADVVWCHGVALFNEPPSSELSRRVSAVGGVLLTLGACRLPVLCGLESHAPRESRGSWRDADDPLWDDGFRDWPDFPHIRGLQGWAKGVHPLFEGFQRGTFTRHFADGDPFTELAYTWPDWPQGDNARVIAVERAYVRLHSPRAIAWEYLVGERRVLCVGAHVPLLGDDRRLRMQRDRLLGNALALVARSVPPATTEATWPKRSALTRPGVAGTKMLSDDTPALVSERGTNGGGDAPFTIAGRRALITGTERNGIEDIWIHPLAMVSGGLQLAIEGIPPEVERVQVTPVEIRRALRAGQQTAIERIAPALADAAVLLSYESPSDRGAFEVRFRLPIRLEWPFDADALWPLKTKLVRGDARRHVVEVVGCDDQHIALITIDGADDVASSFSGPAPALVIASNRGANLRILFRSGTGGIDALRAAADGGLGVGQDFLAERERHFASLRQRTIRSRTPNEVLDAGIHWAIHRLDMFLARTPDDATGLMAGYATSGDGWSVSRPGYAWFFGRDACWCADAMLAAGMFDEVREMLRHLASTRDITGKMIHELTTSGVAHYDAADSTPLFLRLVAAYAEWTNDLSLVREMWDAVRDAINFVASTDHDRDGLPENTNVGHGWIESGPLGGGAVTSYVAAIWIEALRRLTRIAVLLDDESAAAACRGLLFQAQRAFDQRLRDPVSGRVFLQLQHDGAPQDDLTALSAVPIAIGVDRHASADDVLRHLSSPEYAAQWGVRLIPKSDPRYNPRGYHYGAVWPLFTGWTALACFERGHRQDGMRLLEANASLWTRRAKGAFDEVLDGDDGSAAGVCPDQAWSAAMAIAPLVRGLWGIQPNAPARAIRVAVQLPAEWKTAALEGVRIGQATIDLLVRRVVTQHAVIEQIAFLVHDAPGSLETVVIEVLSSLSEPVDLRTPQGMSLATTTRECRPGWIWQGVTLAVGAGEGQVDVHRRTSP